MSIVMVSEWTVIVHGFTATSILGLERPPTEMAKIGLTTATAASNTASLEIMFFCIDFGRLIWFL